MAIIGDLLHTFTGGIIKGGSKPQDTTPIDTTPQWNPQDAQQAILQARGVVPDMPVQPQQQTNMFDDAMNLRNSGLEKKAISTIGGLF